MAKVHILCHLLMFLLTEPLLAGQLGDSPAGLPRKERCMAPFAIARKPPPTPQSCPLPGFSLSTPQRRA